MIFLCFSLQKQDRRIFWGLESPPKPGGTTKATGKATSNSFELFELISFFGRKDGFEEIYIRVGFGF